MKMLTIFVALAAGAITAPAANAKINGHFETSTIERGSSAVVDVQTSAANRTRVGLIAASQEPRFKAGKKVAVSAAVTLRTPIGSLGRTANGFLRVTLATTHLQSGRYLLVLWFRTNAGWRPLVPAVYTRPRSRTILTITS